MTATGPSRSVELARHSALELILTSILLFGVTTIVRFVVGPSPISRAFPQIHVELLIVGAGVGVLLTGLIKSPVGKISGQSWSMCGPLPPRRWPSFRCVRRPNSRAPISLPCGSPRFSSTLAGAKPQFIDRSCRPQFAGSFRCAVSKAAPP